MTTGFAVEVKDEDTTTDDTILSRPTIVPSESDLLMGYTSFSTGTTLPGLSVSLPRD